MKIRYATAGQLHLLAPEPTTPPGGDRLLHQAAAPTPDHPVRDGYPNGRLGVAVG